MLASRINSAVPTAGTGYEMNAITALSLEEHLCRSQRFHMGTTLVTILMTLIDNAGIQFGINSIC